MARKDWMSKFNSMLEISSDWLGELPEGLHKLKAQLKPQQSTQNAEFDQLAADWWELQGPMAPLHKLNPLRALYLDTNVALGGKRLLDVGCGGGIFTEAMAERGAQVTAIDPSPELIEVAKDHSASRGLKIDYICTSTQALLREPKFRESFEIVCCLEVLEHVAAPQNLVAECAALVAPTGWGYFSTINKTAQSFLLAIVAAEYVLRWLPRGTHSHAQFIKPAELCEYLAASQLLPRKIRGVTYNPLLADFELSDQVHTNYLLLSQKAETAATPNP